MVCAWINGIATSVWSKIVYPYIFFVVADGTKVTAYVLLVRDSLPPYVTCFDKYFRDIRHFTFTTSTTFNQYVDAVVSGRVPWELPLAPGFPSILISFSYNSFDAKFHHTCPGIMSWHGQISRTFELDSDAILALADETKKNTFWCSACHRGLFFPNTCQFHPH